MRTWHRRTPSFKVMVVEEVLKGEQTQEQICRTYGVCRQEVIKWKKAYQQQGPEAFAQESASTSLAPAPEASQSPKALPSSKQRQIEELERQCGRLLVENELLKKLLGRAGYKIDMP